MSDVPDPKTWATGGDPMTSKQEGFIQSLAEQKGVDVDTANLDKGSASQKIEELKSAPNQAAEGSTTSGQNKQDEAIDQDPAQWSTGAEPATQKQKGYIAAMAKKAGEEPHLNVDKAEASKEIEDLKEKTGM